MPNLLYIKAIQLTLWALTVPAAAVLLRQGFGEPFSTQLFGVTFLGVRLSAGLHFDILSGLLFFMITLLGASIGQYSLRYLAGEKRQAYFFTYLLGIVASASALVLSSNLLMFFVMWLAISFNLHKLLTYYPDRPAALSAARKKAIVSRLGDIALLCAIVMTYRLFGTLEFTEIFQVASGFAPNSADEGTLSIIGLLIVLGALTKSAQFPFHFWLPETMETPTPVSALMHAGVINAGGILIIRFSPILDHAAWAHINLILAGTVSASFGALCMIVQNDIKRKLAYSTISQMGMMMLACGLGAYSVALFHIFAHSFYKAYAFLATGKLVEESKKVGLSIEPPSPSVLWLAGTVGLVAIVSSAFIKDGAHIALVTYAVVLFLGFAQNLPKAPNLRPIRIRTASVIMGILALASGIYLLLEHSLSLSVAAVVPTEKAAQLSSISMLSVGLLVFAFFFGTLLLSARLMSGRSALGPRLYIYLRNGGYLGLRTSVLLGRTTS